MTKFIVPGCDGLISGVDNYPLGARKPYADDLEVTETGIEENFLNFTENPRINLRFGEF
jgi:hypothetical protein